MEARDFAEALKDLLEANPTHAGIDVADARWAFGDSDFFLETDENGTFLVTVAKVAE